MTYPEAPCQRISPAPQIGAACLKSATAKPDQRWHRWTILGVLLIGALSLSGCANLPTAPDQSSGIPSSRSSSDATVAASDDRIYGFGDGLLNKRLPSNPLAAINGENAPRSAATEAVLQAMAQLGVAYQRGGSSAGTGFDCSGLTSYAYRQADITLPRTAREQYAFTQRIAKAQLKPGDLLFFKIRSRKIDHVGIYVGDNRFIMRPGSASTSNLPT